METLLQLTQEITSEFQINYNDKSKTKIKFQISFHLVT